MAFPVFHQSSRGRRRAVTGGGGASYADLILSHSPTGYWRLGEALGTTGSGSILDASGNGRHGTPSGSVTFGSPGLIAGDADTAADFGGSVSLPSTGAGAGGVFTYECWIAFTANNANRGIFGGGNSGNNNDAAWFRTTVADGTKIEFFYRNAAGSSVSLAWAASLNDGNPHHLAATGDGTTLRLYVDAVALGSTVALPATKASLNLGCIGAIARASPVNSVIATLDECAEYAATLTAAQILEHYETGTGV